MPTSTRRPLAACRGDFPALARHDRGRPLAFLDGPAGSQVPAAVIDAVSGYYRSANANSGGYFPTSVDTDALLEGVRATVAAFLGAESAATISFGANMTTLAFSLSHALARGWRPGDEVVVTALDHEANRGPWLRLRERGIVVREVALRRDGRLDPDDFARQVTERTRLVAMGAGSNALGTVNDLALGRRLASAAGALLLVDAVHYAPHFPIDVGELSPDFLIFSAYKLYGPHVGLLYSRPGLLDSLDADRLRTQDPAAPYRIETGTLNHAAIAGVGAAIEYLASWGEGGSLRERLVDAFARLGEHERAVSRHYYERVREVPGVTVWGPDFSDAQRAPTVSITVDGLTSDEVARALAEEGIQVWSGHFYAVRALEVLGLDQGVVRAGVLMYNTREEIDRLADAVARLA